MQRAPGTWPAVVGWVVGICGFAVMGALAGGALSFRLLEIPSVPGVWGAALMALLVIFAGIALATTFELDRARRWACTAAAVTVLLLFSTSLLVVAVVAASLGLCAWVCMLAIEQVERSSAERACSDRVAWRDASPLDPEAQAHAARAQQLRAAVGTATEHLTHLLSRMREVHCRQHATGPGILQVELAESERLLIEAIAHINADITQLEDQAHAHEHRAVTLSAAAAAARAIRWRAPAFVDDVPQLDLAMLEAEAEVEEVLRGV